MKSDWDLSREVSGLSLEDSLLSSSVYQRVSRYELQGNSITQGLPNLGIGSSNRDLPSDPSKIPANSGTKHQPESLLEQIPPLGVPRITPEIYTNPSPNTSVPPSILTETDRTIGQESQVRLLPTRQTSAYSGLPSGLMVVQPDLIPTDQPGLMPVEQADLIPVESKPDTGSGLIPANSNRLPPLQLESSIATSKQSLILSLG